MIKKGLHRFLIGLLVLVSISTPMQLQYSRKGIIFGSDSYNMDGRIFFPSVASSVTLSILLPYFVPLVAPYV